LLWVSIFDGTDRVLGGGGGFKYFSFQTQFRGFAFTKARTSCT
jgi:hypothetical protein